MSPEEMIAKLHYPTRAERTADWWVHAVGMTFAAVGGGALLGLMLGLARYGAAASLAIYAAGLFAMFACSWAYNMSTTHRQPIFRRLDHAAIFLMIAGSYTPFTTQRLEGGWAVGMTAAVWVVALAGVFGKLFLPGLARGIWVAVYLALGWIAVVAIKPMLQGVPAVAMLLLAIGGAVYSTGVLIYVRKTLPFRRAIWHSFVVGAAATHFAAIIIGVVLPAEG